MEKYPMSNLIICYYSWMSATRFTTVNQHMKTHIDARGGCWDTPTIISKILVVIQVTLMISIYYIDLKNNSASVDFEQKYLPLSKNVPFFNECSQNLISNTMQIGWTDSWDATHQVYDWQFHKCCDAIYPCYLTCHLLIGLASQDLRFGNWTCCVI